MNDQTVPVPNDDGIEMEPVIYCVLTCLALLANEPHRELARLSGGARVMAVSLAQRDRWARNNIGARSHRTVTEPNGDAA